MNVVNLQSQESSPLASIDLSRLPLHVREELLELLEMKREWDKYNVLERFKPYEFQKKFYEASANFKRRFLCAANR